MRFRFRYVLLGLLAIILAVGVPVLITAVRFTREYEKLTIGDVNPTAVADGVRTGTCDIGPVVVEAEVTVAGGVITDITLKKHVNGQGSAAEAITAKVIEAQSLKVDMVSGATISSKVILKAIENALTGSGG